MNKITIVIIVLIIIVLGYFLLTSSGDKAPTQDTTPQVEVESKEATSETLEVNENVVIYNGDGYSPSVLKVKIGTIVTFKNNSSQKMWVASVVHPTHKAYDGTSLSEHCNDADGTAFDSCEGTQVGDSWQFTFDKEGTWKYHNHLNPRFSGTVIVEDVPNLSQAIIGTWGSTDDEKSVKIFRADGTTEDIYDGEVLSVGEWKINDKSLEVNDGTEVLMYTILKADEDQLELSFLPRGSTLSYTKIEG